MPKAKKDNKKAIDSLLSRNVEDVTVGAHLRAALDSGKKLRVKLGIDPTGSKIHIGRAVVLWKLREFQDLGHKVVFIVGDFTARIGDASDKLAKRPMLTKAEIKKNLKNYLPQVGKIIDLKKVEIRYNSEWLSKLRFDEICELAEVFTVNQMIERRNFKERWDKHEEISLREFMYPLMQGYDSVMVKADVELGGTDQLFNLMAGRRIQERYGMKPQDVITTGMLNGLDGRKMSTSWGNVINIVDEPDDQFGKLMAMNDSEIINYFRFATRVSEEEIQKFEKLLKQGENPKNVKLALAREVVTLYHSAKKSEAAAERWNKLFSKKDIAEVEAEELRLKKTVSALEIVLSSKVLKSRSEAWRLIEQGGLKINDVVVHSPKEEVSLSGGEFIRIGKKKFFRAVI